MAQAEPLAPAASPEALDHVHQVVSRSGSSFTWGMRMLPRPRREAMYAIYAFCREVDDVADEPAPREDKMARLAEWRVEIDRLYAGAPTRPTTRALLPQVEAFDLPKEEFLAIIDGMLVASGLKSPIAASRLKLGIFPASISRFSTSGSTPSMPTTSTRGRAPGRSP